MEKGCICCSRESYRDHLHMRLVAITRVVLEETAVLQSGVEIRSDIEEESGGGGEDLCHRVSRGRSGFDL
jgi:hypothetical protein